MEETGAMARERDPEQHTFAKSSIAPARQKVLKTATRLFYEEGMRTVGINQVIDEAGLAKATFYKHFRSRANLIQQYIYLLCTEERDALTAIGNTAPTA